LLEATLGIAFHVGRQLLGAGLEGEGFSASAAAVSRSAC
jgi:hypothetical protein